MTTQSILEQMQARLQELFAQSPARDLEQNVRAVMRQGFAKLDLATREELELQVELVRRAQERIRDLEARIARLEERSGS
jgi:BMFP domain-containing protein YqiC